MGLLADIEGYERRLKSFEQELEREKSFTNEFACKIIVLSCEIERLNQEGAVMSKTKSREYTELQEGYSKLQSKVTAKNN
jgi:predicted RNase H-like nuclease (RuvC/YqgF family)